MKNDLILIDILKNIHNKNAGLILFYLMTTGKTIIRRNEIIRTFGISLQQYRTAMKELKQLLNLKYHKKRKQYYVNTNKINELRRYYVDDSNENYGMLCKSNEINELRESRNGSNIKNGTPNKPNKINELSKNWNSKNSDEIKEKENKEKRTKKETKEKENYIYIKERKENKKEKKESIFELTKKIVNYLNEVACREFRATNKKTQRLIKARLNEGFVFDDFKLVIDFKTKQWQNDEKFSQFLRPETLFSNKFEGYLNAGKTHYKPDVPEKDEYKEIQQKTNNLNEKLKFAKTKNEFMAILLSELPPVSPPLQFLEKFKELTKDIKAKKEIFDLWQSYKNEKNAIEIMDFKIQIQNGNFYKKMEGLKC